jgi:preprotein translocase subunit SecY
MQASTATTTAHEADARSRLAVTVAAALLVLAARGIPLPGVRPLHYPELGYGPLRLSIMELGIAPFVWASVLVELVALTICPLRVRRIGGRAQRRPLEIAALVLGAALGLLFSWSWTETRVDPQFLGHFPGARLVAILSLVAGSAALVAVARWVGRSGLGDGFALVLAAQALAAVPRWWRSPGATPTGIAVAAVASLLLVALLVNALLSNDLTIGTAGGPTIRHPASGLAPVYMASTVLLLPSTLSRTWPALKPLGAALRPGSGLYLGLLFALVAVLALGFARLFNGPDRVASVWSRLPGAPGAVQLRAGALAALRGASVRAATLLPLLACVPWVIGRATGAFLLTSGLVELCLALAAVADVRAEWRARRAEPGLVPVLPEQRVYASDAAVAALRGAGIPAFVRAVHFRTLTQFFGPYAPMVVFVPRGREADASALLSAAR